MSKHDQQVARELSISFPYTDEVVPDMPVYAFQSVDIGWDTSQFNADSTYAASAVLTYTTAPTTPWYTINDADASISGIPSSNSYAGNFIITMNLSDTSGAFNVYSFNLEIQENEPPQLTSTLPDIT